MATRAGRKKTQLPDCYYEGYLEKKSFKDKTPQKLWTCLCGDTLFFFNNKRDNDYIEKLDLAGFISVTNDTSLDCNLDAAKFTLQMKESNVKFTAMSLESRELWKGFIQSVAELSVPSSLNLLPGQIHMLTEVVKKEKDRIRHVPSTTDTDGSHYLSLHPDMPTCYYPVSRFEAQLLLEREAERGNMLLRPGRDGTSFAITTRQELDRVIFRHYRVTRKHEGGFIIAVENPVHCTTLYDVITYVVDKTDGILIPLIIEDYYEEKITIVASDNESGEKMEQTLPDSLPPRLPPKPASIPNPEPAPEPASEERLKRKENKTGDLPVVPPPVPEKKPIKTLTPPIPLPRKGIPATSASSSSTSTPNKDLRAPVNADIQRQLPLVTMTELKLKLKQKAQYQV